MDKVICDNCKKKIKFNDNDYADIIILSFNTFLYQFCCLECRDKYIDLITFKAKIDKANHINIIEQE